MLSQLKIKISAKAKFQIAEIYRYSLKNWGKKTAEKYVREIETAIGEVAAGRKLTRINPEFSNTNPYCSVNSHNIFFELGENELIVLSVLHNRMNL